MGAGAAAGGDGQKMHAEAGGADAFASNSSVVGEALLAGVTAGGADLAAFGHEATPASVGAAYHGLPRTGEREGMWA